MGAALGAIGAVALAVGLVVGAGLPGSSRGAGTPKKAAGSSTVQRRDLVATDTEAGTLSYADPQTVFNRISGTITWLPSIGQVIAPGGTLYKVDGNPVVLMNGTFPAYRQLSSGVSDGPDVGQLNQNLRRLGFDTADQITLDDTWQSATTAAVDRWQASLGESQTGVVSLGEVAFLPGRQRVTAVDTTLGSTGGSSGTGSSGSGSGSSAAASTVPSAPRAEFVSLTTTTTTTATTPTTPTKAPRKSKRPPSAKGGGSAAQTIAALLALLKAETLELQRSRASSASAASGAGGKSAGSSSASRAGATSGGGASTSASAGSASSGGAGASAILQTSSTRLVVTVDLDATKQSEAVVGEPVTVELPSGDTVAGKISYVSPVAQSSSSSSSSSSGNGAGSSSAPATIPVTITLSGRRPAGGLDQAAVSVNFEQQKATGVLSVPVTALLATAGGGYAVQEVAAPHAMIPVTPGLFAAGYVQVSGPGIYPGLQVTDSQG